MIRQHNTIVALVSSVAGLLAMTLPALAGLPTPVPLAGLAGPYGLLAAGAVYGGYRLVKHFRKQP